MSNEKWKCPKCGTENDAENASCGECGSKKAGPSENEQEKNVIDGQVVTKQEKKTEAFVLTDASEETEKKGCGGCLGCFGKSIVILFGIIVLGVALSEGVSIKVVLSSIYGEFSRAPETVKLKGHVHGREWSYPSDHTMNWEEAFKYCDNLTEDGHSDWRLPTISELRRLIKECPKTILGGSCPVSDDCLKCSSPACEGCLYSRSGIYSAFGETGDFWSSSSRSGYPEEALRVKFYDGSVFPNYQLYNSYVRCVR